MNYCNINPAGLGGTKRCNSSISGNNATGGEQRSSSRRGSRSTVENSIGSSSEESAERGYGGAPIELNFENFFDNDDALKELLIGNEHFKHRASVPTEKSMIGLLVSQLGSGNIQAYRSKGNGSESNPHTHRCSFNIKGLIATPYRDYIPVLTNQGETFIQQFNEKSVSFHAYCLVWQYAHVLETLKNLIDYHCDQSRLDIDANGEPNKFINREVSCSGMDFILLFKMIIVWYDSDGKRHERKIAGCEIVISGGHHSYCMDPVASGRHSAYKMMVPSNQIDGTVDGKLYNIIFMHSTRRINTNTNNSQHDNRIILNRDFQYNSAAEAAAGMNAFATGTQDSTDLTEWVTSGNQINTSSAWIDSTIASMRVHEPGDRLWCRSCAHRATCVDKRPLPSNVVQNENDVSLIQGNVVVVYWDEDPLDPNDDDLENEDLSELACVGVITHVAMDGNRVTSLDVTFVEEGDDQYPRSHWTVNNMNEMNLLYPAEQQDIDKLLGNRHLASNDSIHRNTLCDMCAMADSGLMTSKVVNLLENPCMRCAKEDHLPGLSGCATCLGNPRCNGQPGEDGTRKFYCAGIHTEVGVPLTAANCSSNEGYICTKCYNVKRNGVQERKVKYTDDVWETHFTAISSNPNLYTYQKGKKAGKIHYDAVMGKVDGIPGVPSLIEHFGGRTVLYRRSCVQYWSGADGKKIKESTNCTKCRESATGKCDDVGKSIDNLALFKVYRDHCDDGGRQRAKKSRFDDIEYEES